MPDLFSFFSYDNFYFPDVSAFCVTHLLVGGNPWNKKTAESRNLFTLQNALHTTISIDLFSGNLYPAYVVSVN